MNEQRKRGFVPQAATDQKRKSVRGDTPSDLQGARVDTGQLGGVAVGPGGSENLPVVAESNPSSGGDARLSAQGQTRETVPAGERGAGTQQWSEVAWNEEAWKDAVLPFIDQEVEIHPRGLIYLPHERLRNRLNEAFGAGWYRFIPVGEPVVSNNEVLWRYRLEFRDGTCAEAPGHASYYKNSPTASYGDALETAKSDAFARCCKDVGIGLQCWNRDYQIEYMQRYAVRVQSTKDNKWYWRRKDRPRIPYERVSERQQGPDYVPRETLDQANRRHMDSMKPKRGSAWDDSSMDSLTKDEHFAPESDPDDVRRLHEEEERVFADDGRE